MKEIIKKLQQDKTKFTIKGINDYKDEPRIYQIHVSVYKHDLEPLISVNEDRLFGQGMNVEKFGPTCMWLFTYDMFSRKSTFKINYKDIIVIEE